MLDFKNLGDMAKLANQAKEMQRQQEEKHNEQMSLLKRIADTLDQILSELKKSK